MVRPGSYLFPPPHPTIWRILDTFYKRELGVGGSGVRVCRPSYSSLLVLGSLPWQIVWEASFLSNFWSLYKTHIRGEHPNLKY